MKKQFFHIPNGLVYLDGNSLGPLPKLASSRIQQTISDEWGEFLIRAWNQAGWMDQPGELGDRIGDLIGAPAGSVVIGDTLSIKVYQAVAAALNKKPDRSVVLSDTGNFPTDLYMVDGLIKTMNRSLELKLVEPEEVADALDDSVAVLLLTHIDYRTGRMHDMQALTKKAQDLGIITVWDLAHSAGAVPVDLAACQAEFAVGCTYKYLNGGPGAPAFIYVRPDLCRDVEPCLAGWLGHAAPFAFDPEYTPAPSIQRMRVGTPSVLQMAALEAALDVWDDVCMDELRARTIELSELFITEIEARCPMLELVSPRDPEQRGSQVSFAFDDGYAVIQALIAKGVIGDFRAPNVMRFGFTPLYLDIDDVNQAIEILVDIMDSQSWDQEEFKTRSAVT